MKKHLKYLLPVLIVIFWGCSTEKNAVLNRGYHNMTAHYNGYYNARELIKESLMTYRTGFKEDYTQILPVFIYPKDQDVSGVFKPMNDAVEKTERVINRHSMPNPAKMKGSKVEEWCKWIDENWLVMGQAYFYKREYGPAIEKFDYITKAYKYNIRKYDALIWMAKSHIENKDFLKADEIFIKLEEKIKEGEDAKKNKGKKEEEKKSSKKSKGKPSGKKKKKKDDKPQEEPPFPDDLKDELYSAQADMYLRMEKYDKAIDYLKLSIKHTKKKRDRARLNFILAQIYEKKSDYASATNSYTEVLKLNPTFEMEFYATINRALIYQGGDSRTIKSQLLKMLRDEKNKDFFDQIYYALGEIEMKENDKAKGISYFEKSAAASLSNDRQKGRTYLKLGDIYFADRDFVPSKAYYDSAVTFLPQTYPKYIEIKLKSESLADLVNNLNEYHLQDSLLKLGTLDESKLARRVDEIIKQQNDEDERKRLEEEAKKQKQPDPSEGSPGGWYFYNPTAMAQGNAEFKKKWGPSRKNEDNWRRVNKSQILEDGSTSGDDDSTLSAGGGSRNREDYLKKIPVTEEQRKAAHKKLRASLYNAAVLYKTNFGENKLALSHFNELVKRYQEGPEVCPSYYQIYLLTEGTADASDAKNHIFQDCPDSEYRYIIEDPDYAKKLEQNKSKDEQAYMLVFNEYAQKKYDITIEKCNQVILNEKTNQYLPNYLFLKALSFGSLGNMEEMDKILSDIVARYPVHEIGKEANAMLDYLRNRKSMEDAKSGLSTFIFEKNAEHYFIMVLPKNEGSVNDVKSDFSDFNTQYFNGAGLKVTNNFLDLDNQLVIVKSFENKQKAMEYYNAFKNDNSKVKKYNDKREYFVISNKNYASFFIEKKVPDYKKFFEDNYLK